MTTKTTSLSILQQNVGPCREWPAMQPERCGKPAEYVLWGKLVDAEGLGPRCYDCALKWIGHNGLSSRSGWALINLSDLAADLDAA